MMSSMASRGSDSAAAVVSVPMMAYRVAMLAWSLWLALSLLSWLKRGFAAFATGGLWREVPRPPPRAPPASSAAAKAGEGPGAPTSAAVPSTGPAPPKP